MIHQFIFAGPRPGWFAERFQNYWLREHSVRYAARIPQIRQYLVAPRERIPGMPSEVPFFEGVAEIWLRNDAEQIDSLMSDEYLKGARLDEPNWAAFWQTFVHESSSDVAAGGASASQRLFKVYLFIKRRPAHGLAQFHDQLTGPITGLAQSLPSLSTHLVAPARESAYGFGEPRFDAIEVLGFPSRHLCHAALASSAWKEFLSGLLLEADETAFFVFSGRENWIIRPGERP